MAKMAKTKRNRISSSNLFLMELIVALLIFSVSGAACVSIFMKSHKMSEHASELSRITDATSSVAELIRGCTSVPELFEAVANAYPEGILDAANAGNTEYISFFIFVDENGISCKAEDAVSLIAVEATYTESLLEATLLGRKTDGKGDMSGDIVTELAVKHYIPEGTGSSSVEAGSVSVEAGNRSVETDSVSVEAGSGADAAEAEDAGIQQDTEESGS